jgi:hypothetical protein
MAEGDAPPKIIAEFVSYDEMLAAVRNRVAELGVCGERFDEFAGLPRGYLSKLIGARPIRRIAMTSMAPVLAGLGLKGQFVEDPIGTERLKNRVVPRNGSYVRGGVTHLTLTARFMQKIGRLGAQARIDNSTAEQRRKWARRAAFVRWRGT